MNTPSSGSYLNFACACRGVSTTTWTSVLEANAGSARRSAILLFGGLGRHQRRRHGLDADVADAAEHDCFHEMLRDLGNYFLRFAAAFLPPLRDAVLLVYLLWPEPLFLLPPLSLLVVAQARALASFADTPRFL